MSRGDTVKPAHLALLAGINAVLGALEETMPIEVVAAARAVVADDGRQIRLTLYSKTGAVASVTLDPVRAVAFAGRLIEATLPQLSSPSRDQQPSDRPQGAATDTADLKPPASHCDSTKSPGNSNVRG